MKARKPLFHLVVMHGHVDVLDGLYQQIPNDQRSDVMKQRTSDGESVLQCSMRAENPIPILEWAQQKNLDFLEIDEHSGSVLHAAVGESQVEAVEWLCKNYPDLLKIQHENRSILEHAQSQTNFWRGSSSSEKGVKMQACLTIETILRDV